MRQSGEVNLHARGKRLELVNFLRIHERDDRARLARTCRTPRTVAIGAHILRKVNMNDVVHVLNIESSRGEVGGDKDFSASRTDGIKRCTSLVTPLLSKQGNGLDTLIAQLFERVRRVEAASDKDEPSPDRQTARQLLHRLYFITKRHNIIVIFIRLIRTLHADEARGEQLLRHAHGSRACRRREKKRLPLRREESDKSTHIVEMLLAEESVELVQDEDLHTHEFQLTEAVQFLHARCRTDDEGRLLLECFDLPLDVRSAPYLRGEYE